MCLLVFEIKVCSSLKRRSAAVFWPCSGLWLANPAISYVFLSYRLSFQCVCCVQCPVKNLQQHPAAQQKQPPQQNNLTYNQRSDPTRPAQCLHETSVPTQLPREFFQRRSDLLQLLQKVHVQQPSFKIAINGTAHVQQLNVIRGVPGFCSVSSKVKTYPEIIRRGGCKSFSRTTVETIGIIWLQCMPS